MEQTDGRFGSCAFSRKLRHRPEKVWLALTEPDNLAAWFPTEDRG